MRVLMIVWEYPPHIVGGLGAHVADITPELAAEGMQVLVLTPQLRGGETEETTPSGVQVSRVGMPNIDNRNFISFVAQVNQHLEYAAYDLYVKHGGFDLIHTHDWLTASSAISLKQRWHIPLAATIHSTERGRGRGMLHGDAALQIDSLEYQLSYEAWRVIVCSHFMARQLVDTFQTPRDKIDVVPNGTNVRPGPFLNEQERQTFRRRYVPDETSIIFYVGRVVYEKGLHILIDALPRVLQRVDVHLVIAGTGSYLNNLKAQAEAMGISQHVTFTGFISDEERDCLYHVADVTTFPSLYEPFGIVVLEAYAARSPVVASQTGGLAEVVVPEETGTLVLPGNADSLAWGVLRTLQETSQTQVRIEKAYQYLCQHFNWRHIARETIAVYDHIYQEWQRSSWGKEVFQSPEEKILCQIGGQVGR